jgi:manganese transport protein
MKSKLYWWVIAAAFIGPGTVTTAARAGASYGFELVWAVVVSVLACIVLQEASARVTIVTGKPLARVMGDLLGNWVMMVVAVAVGVGCLAYEAGNITGAASGIALIAKGEMQTSIVVVISIIAGMLLWYGTIQAIAKWLGFVVLIMGMSFLMAAIGIFSDPAAFFAGMITPKIPEGGTITVIGLIGTTIVPYALFLGSGIAKGREVPEMRTGVIWSVAVGGVITLGILVSGTAVQGDFSFVNMASMLESTYGAFFSWSFALGLFAAGLTSAITAPTALGIVVSSVWPDISVNGVRAVRIVVVIAGAAVSLSGFNPVAIIVTAQALNGILLPLTALSLALVMMQPSIRSLPYANKLAGNVVLWLSTVVSIILGLTAIYRLIV